MIRMMQVYFVLALDTVEPERGFNYHKIIKSSLRTRLKTVTMDSLMRIRLLVPSFDFERAKANLNDHSWIIDSAVEIMKTRSPIYQQGKPSLLLARLADAGGEPIPFKVTGPEATLMGGIDVTDEDAPAPGAGDEDEEGEEEEEEDGEEQMVEHFAMPVAELEEMIEAERVAEKKYGCSKCRWAVGGCKKCRDPEWRKVLGMQW